MARYDAFIRRHFDVKGESGDERVCVCPWHDDRGKPNLYINAVRGVYVCHACGEKGHLSKMGGELPSVDLRDIREKMRRYRATHDIEEKSYSDEWLDQFDFEHDYWKDRGFSQETIELFNLGWDPFNDRVTIPIRDSHGKVLGVVQRVLDGSKPKYLDPVRFKKGQNLFASWLIRQKNVKKVGLVEGPADAIAMWDAGVPAMAMYGARLTPDQSRLIQKLGVQTIVVMTDNDSPGQGWPRHQSDPDRNGKCRVCRRPRSRPGDEHAVAGVWQIREALGRVPTLVGVYEDRWKAKDPGELTVRQRIKLFHGAIPFSKWRTWD